MQADAANAIEAAINKLPASLGNGVRHWFERLAADRADDVAQLDLPDAMLDGLIRIVACSDYAAGIILRDWDWFAAALASRRFGALPCREDLASDFATLASDPTDRATFVRQIRQRRHRAMVHILWTDLVAGCDVTAVLDSLSDLADCAVRSAIEFACCSHAERYGEVLDDGEPVPLVVLAMGKLGGRELNFSSDIDLVFLYPIDGETSGAKVISAHEYFTRVARVAASLLEEVTPEGFVYRVDTRLRPFGESGPPVLSFTGLESYLLEHGRSWERYAYIKARMIAPEDADLARGLNHNIIRPFVYRRYLDYGVFESLREMKALVAAEVRKREMANNIKLGPGGIREIEFIVQALQLLRGGSADGLRTTRLLEALRNAVDDRDLTGTVAKGLAEAYTFLRRLENYLQARRDQQTHDLPDTLDEQQRIAYAMQFDDWDALAAAIDRHREFVSAQFAAVAFRGGANGLESPSMLRTLWLNRASPAEWQDALTERGYQSADELAEVLVEFANRPSTRRVDSIAANRLSQFVPQLLKAIAERDDPATILTRVFGIVDRVLRRSAYIALLNENQPVLDRLVEICATSAYLADEVARFPVLLDELFDSRRYERAPDASEVHAELRKLMRTAESEDSEQQVEVLAEFKRATQFRLAVADFSGSIPLMKVSDRLTQIAELILARALTLAHADMVARFGAPKYLLDGKWRTAGMGIIAYGKLGGMELSYGSDLDIVFLHDSRGEQQQTSGSKAVDNSVFFARLARRLVHFLTTQTGSGALYEVDTRLRPSGRAGLLVTSIDAFERYQDENAWTWEHQALLRARAIAGSSVVEREFERIRVQTLRKRVRRDQLASDVIEMRRKMRDNLDRSTADAFDLKQGAGGIADIEFLVQFLVLAHADDHPAVVHYSDNIRQLGTLAASACLAEEECRRLQEIYKAYREFIHRLALDLKPAFAPTERFVDERRFVTDLWGRIFGGALEEAD